MGTKMPIFQNSETCHFEKTPQRGPKQTGAKCLVFNVKGLVILKTLRFDTRWVLAERSESAKICFCAKVEQCQMVVFLADDLGSWGPGFWTSQ